jgi:DNA segregation ATPase FtsK/SpoIIIE, S-DNA-T family
MNSKPTNRRIHLQTLSASLIHACCPTWASATKPVAEHAGNIALQVNPPAPQDPLFKTAVALVIDFQEVGIGLIQRHLKIGFNRASQLVEAMTAVGIVSALNAEGKRTLQPKYRRPPQRVEFEIADTDLWLIQRKHRPWLAAMVKP